MGIKRFRFSEGAEVHTDLRFLRRGDIYWYEDASGTPVPMPSAGRGEDSNFEVVYFTAVTNAIWDKNQDGERCFKGIKYRDASEAEILAMQQYLGEA